MPCTIHHIVHESRLYSICHLSCHWCRVNKPLVYSKVLNRNSAALTLGLLVALTSTIKKLLIFFACKAPLTFVHYSDQAAHSDTPQPSPASGHCSVCLMAVQEVLSLQPLTSQTGFLNKQLIGWVSCLAWWERRLFLSVYRVRPLSRSQSCTLRIVYERTMSSSTTVV